MDPRDVAGETDGVAGPVDDDHRRAGDDLLVALPGRQSGRGVVADDREQVGARRLLGECGKRVGGEARPAEVDLQPSGFQAGDVGDRRLDHHQAVQGRGDRAARLLLPGDVGHHQHHDVELEGVADVDCGDEVPHVRRIERAAEQADTSEATWGMLPGHRRGNGGGGPAWHGGAVYVV